MSVLDVQALRKHFGAVPAAADISLSFDADTVVSLIGANGAGKTTFLNMVTGYLRPDSGRIVFDGRDIVGLSPRQITKLGVARSFQIPQLFQTLSVRDNLLIAESIAAAEDPQAATEAVLERFTLRGYAAQPAGLLPEGIRKLLDVAMALSSRSRLLLLDEPTSGVSAEEKFPMMDTIMAALGTERDTTVLFVEHDMDIVARYADRVIAFYSGRIIADDVPHKALGTDDVRRYVTGELLQEAPS